MTGQELSAEVLGRRFVDAFNRRDADALVALCHPELEFQPTVLVGQRAIYHGHEGLRHWLEQVIASGATHEARVRTVRALDDERLALLTEVCLDGDVVSPSAMVVRVKDGLIVHAKAYLSDEQTLIRVGVLPPEDA